MKVSIPKQNETHHQAFKFKKLKAMMGVICRVNSVLDLGKMLKIMVRDFSMLGYKKQRNFINDLDRYRYRLFCKPSAYDTAWVARIPDRRNQKKPMFPKCLAWVQRHQLKDGSWGAEGIEYFHDRIICTLSCIVALKTWGVSPRRIKRGEEYIRKNLRNLRRDAHATVGFELLFPSLLETAKSLSLNLPFRSMVVDKYKVMRLKKLDKIPDKMLYRRRSSLSFSLEFLEGTKVDFNRLKIHQEKNGSYGCTPAASAFVLINTVDINAERYLKNVGERFGNYFPLIFSIDVFERAWVIDHFINCGIADIFRKEFETHIRYLYNAWTTRGIAWSKFFSVPDLDDTSVVFRILGYFNYIMDTKVFEKFRYKSSFRCYPSEKESTPSHLGNFLETLLTIPISKDNARCIKLTHKLIGKTLNRNYTDKWHLSPYYTVSRLSIYSKFGTSSKENKLFDNICHWILGTQKRSGGWGLGSIGTLEETAYALSVLIRNSEINSNKFKKSIYWGNKFLLANINLKNSLPLWIGKCLYSPNNVSKLIPLGSAISFTRSS